jgi:lysozyme family protein
MRVFHSAIYEFGDYAMPISDPIGEVLLHEGGWVDHPNDRGGATNRGITLKTYREWLGRSASKDELRQLTEAEAREIYEKRYLTDPRIHTLPNPPMTLILDMRINHGPRKAIRIMQRVINLAGFGPVDQDGILGPQTRDRAIAAQQTMGPYFQNAIVDERIKFFQRIAANNPSQQVFLKGWLRRCESFRLPTPGK